MINLPIKSNRKNIGFAIGTGRCGTKFMAKIMGLEPNVASVHERNALNETFHRYCKWYDLPVDHEGFLHTKALEIQQDLEENLVSFEASAYLSFSIKELYDRFKAKFVLLVRCPEQVVNSYLRKGWYLNPVVRADANLIPSYQISRDFHHFLGRIMPSGDRYWQWNQFSRVGKLAWYWNTVNHQVVEQFETIPTSHWRIEKLENLDYSRYGEIANFLGFESQVSQATYEQIAQSRPNAKTKIPTIASWDAKAITEFETEVAPMAKQLGYEYRVNQMLLPKVLVEKDSN